MLRKFKKSNDCFYNENGIENLTIQMKLSNENICIVLIYIPPNVRTQYLNTAIDFLCEKCLHDSRSIYIIGDLNANMLKHPHPLNDVMDSFNLSNVVLGHTCFKNVENPSLIDVIFTNTPRRLTSVLNCVKRH